MNLKELKELINFVSEKGFAEFEIERQGFRLRIRQFQETSNSTLQSATPVMVSPTPAGMPLELPPTRAAESAELPASATSELGAGKSTEAPKSEPLHIIKSPIVGTFYRSSSPTADSFVSIGDQVVPDSVVCIIEAMKLMNEIQAEVSGEVVKIYVENGQPVEYGQPLFGIKT